MPAADLSPYTQANGTTSDGTKFGNMLTYIQGLFNGLDASNWATGKIFAPSKLTQESALDQQGLVWDVATSTWKPGPVSYRKTTSKTVNNTVAETDLLNAEITIGAAVLVTYRMLRVTLFIDALNNTGGAATYRFRLKLGATTVFDTGALSAAASAGRQSVTLTAEMMNLAVATSQAWHGTFGGSAINAAGVNWTVGEGASANGQGLLAGWFNTSAEDTATAKALVASVQLGSASVNLEAKLLGALVEVV